MSFWKEAKRRKVVRVIIAYLIVGWGMIQIADATLDPLRLPEWSYTLVVWLVGLGFPIAVVLGWVLDITPKGIEVTAKVDEEETKLLPDASIAVMPFLNMSGNADNEYFSDGLSEELLNLLARLQSVRVCSRTSSFALKGKDLDMPTIAGQLGVRHVLEGSVRRSGDKVRITAQLVDAVADRHLWSETYDRDLEDIFAVQDEIARHIFESLQLTLTAAEQKAVTSTTENFEALDCYLQGKALYHRTEFGHLEKSRAMFEKAIQLDSTYALAWAGLTYVCVDSFWYRAGERELIDLALESSRKAIELAPNLAESRGARGLALRADEQFEDAEIEFKKAMSLNPRLFEPIHFYAQMARSLKQYELAAELFCKAASVRPEDYQALSIAASMYGAIGDTDQLQELSQESLLRIEAALQLNSNDSRAWVLGALDHLALGNEDKALEWAKKAKEVNPNGNSVAYNTACIFARLGRNEEAVDLLEEAIRLGSRNRRYFESDPDLDSLREHPRFIALLNTI